MRESCLFEGTTELSSEGLVRVNQVNRREGDMQAVGVAVRILNKINHTCLVGRGSSGDRMKSEKLQALDHKELGMPFGMRILFL